MPTEEEKKAAQAARESIEVTSTKPTAQPEVKEEEKKEVDVKEEETKDTVEAKEEAIESSDEKIADLEEDLEDNTLTAKEREKLERRIEKERRKNRDLRSENEALKKQLAEKPTDEGLTEEEVERRAELKAAEKLAWKEFEDASNRIVKSAKQIDSKFQHKVDAMAEEIGRIPGQMIGILDDLPKHGGDVLMYLTDNTDEAEEIYKLSPARMALALKNISDKLEAGRRKKDHKEISKVPEPKDGVGGKGSTPETKASEKDDMETFVAKRNREAEEHRRKKLGISMH